MIGTAVFTSPISKYKTTAAWKSPMLLRTPTRVTMRWCLSWNRTGTKLSVQEDTYIQDSLKSGEQQIVTSRINSEVVELITYPVSWWFRVRENPRRDPRMCEGRPWAWVLGESKRTRWKNLCYLLVLRKRTRERWALDCRFFLDTWRTLCSICLLIWGSVLFMLL